MSTFQRDCRVANRQEKIGAVRAYAINRARQNLKRRIFIKALNQIVAVAFAVSDERIGTVNINRVVARAAVYCSAVAIVAAVVSNYVVPVAAVNINIIAIASNGISTCAAVYCGVVSVIVNVVVAVIAINHSVIAFIVNIVGTGSAIDYGVFAIV